MSLYVPRILCGVLRPHNWHVHLSRSNTTNGSTFSTVAPRRTALRLALSIRCSAFFDDALHSSPQKSFGLPPVFFGLYSLPHTAHALTCGAMLTHSYLCFCLHSSQQYFFLRDATNKAPHVAQVLNETVEYLGCLSRSDSLCALCFSMFLSSHASWLHLREQ